MKLVKKALLSTAIATMIMPAAYALTTPTNGVLTIINTTASEITVKCPNPLKSLPIPPNNQLVIWYGGNPMEAPNHSTIYLALNTYTSGTCHFSVGGREIGHADITLSGQSGSIPLAYEFSTAAITVTPVSGSGFVVNPTSQTGNTDTFTVSKG